MQVKCVPVAFQGLFVNKGARSSPETDGQKLALDEDTEAQS